VPHVLEKTEHDGDQRKGNRSVSQATVDGFQGGEVEDKKDV
jgi:hypothetical protein